MLNVVVILKALVEFAGLLLIGQGLVYVLSFGKHEQNPVYRLMRLLTSPVVRFARMVSPGFVVDKHVPAVALFMLLVAWVALIFFKFRLLLAAQG